MSEDQKRQVLFSAARSDGQGLRRAVNKAIDARTGDHASRALDIMIAVMDGTLIAKARAPNQGEDAASYALVPLVYPTIQQRYDAAKDVYQQRNGKPRSGDAQATLNMNSDGEATLSVPIDPEDMSDDELGIFDLMLQSAQQRREKTIDGEAVRND